MNDAWVLANILQMGIKSPQVIRKVKVKLNIDQLQQCLQTWALTLIQGTGSYEGLGFSLFFFFS